jgi:2-C-methyl-D-erythritol 4-phosphate cytidylyltransferase
MTKPLSSCKDKRSKDRVVAIVPSAGAGKRLGLSTKKPFVNLGGRPLVTYALKTLNGSRSINSIIIASEKFKRLVRRFRLKKVARIVIGGKTRMESVKKCLATIGDDFGIVLIHDGARPFIEKSVIEGSIRLCRRFGGCIVALPENDTVKLVSDNFFIKKTLDRNRVFRAQTPQVFRIDLLKKAYTEARKTGYTDDASLVEALGGRIKVLAGTRRNIKITTKEDLKFAEVLL